jgi:GxxExxY protein
MQLKKIAPDVKLGANVKIADFVNLYGCEVGDRAKIGPFVEIQKNAKVGSNCKIQSHTFICEGVTIEDDVLVGHGVTFINDKYPRATNEFGGLQTEADWNVEPTLVRKGASIGSGSTILSNVTIGEKAIVGAGSVVTRDVPPNTIAAGNPARVLREIQNAHRRGAEDAKNTEVSLSAERAERETPRSVNSAEDSKRIDMNELSSTIIGGAIEVHKALGPGLLESAYEECLCHELELKGLFFERQKRLPLRYKGKDLDCGYRLDMVVGEVVILELKSCEKIDPIHKAQLLTYLKLSGLKLGLILNFNVPMMRDGIVRIVNQLEEQPL